jgi:phosphoglycerol transferase MdoB-like AlkP superfamily enzyme
MRLIFLAFVALAFMTIRGGTRLRPLTTSDITLFVPPTEVATYESFPLLFLESIRQETLPEASWLLNHSSKQINRTTQYQFPDTVNQLPNIVLILVESLGEEYTSLNHGWGHTYTPNLNAWINGFPSNTRFFSNGTKSIHAIPSTFQGIPNWFNQPLIYQSKSNLVMKSVFDYLHELDYTATFLHGGDNNTMGFRSYLYGLGLDHYLGKQELSKENSKSNTWGLHDEVLFDQLHHHIDSLKEPFFTSVFTLSSHHPYDFPNSFNPRQPNRNLPIHDVIEYTDSCLGNFLSQIDFSTPKMANTVFIITADHSSINQLHAYRTESGKYEIPFLMVTKDSLISQKHVGSHYDLLPTILDLCKYNKPFFAFGSSLLRPGTKPVINYDGQRFSVIYKSKCLVADQTGPIALYDDATDPNHLKNLIKLEPTLSQDIFKNLQSEFSDLHWRVENNFFE